MGGQVPDHLMSMVLVLVVGVPAACAATILARHWEAERAGLEERILRFRIAEAQCFCEDDRRVVQQNIIAFMKHQGLVCDTASEAEALEEFESSVHAQVPALFAASLGRVGVPYTFVTVAFLPYTLYGFDWIAVAIQVAEPLRACLCRLLLRL